MEDNGGDDGNGEIVEKDTITNMATALFHDKLLLDLCAEFSGAGGIKGPPLKPPSFLLLLCNECTGDKVEREKRKVIQMIETISGYVVWNLYAGLGAAEGRLCREELNGRVRGVQIINWKSPIVGKGFNFS